MRIGKVSVSKRHHFRSSFIKVYITTFYLIKNVLIDMCKKSKNFDSLSVFIELDL